MPRGLEIEFNECVFCTELMSEKKHSGKLVFGDDGIITKLISFDGFFSSSLTFQFS